MKFSELIKKDCEEAKKAIDSFVVEFRKEVSESVINLTPLDTGYARGNWQASIGGPEKSKIERFDTEAGFAPTTGSGKSIRAMELIAEKETDKSFFLANSVPYIRNLEYYSGSDQAPFGMVRATIADIDYIYDKVLKRIK